MFYSSVVKTAGAVLMSAMMAIPAPLWAKSADSEGSGSAMEGVPVILQPLATEDGRTAYIAIVPVPEESEDQVVSGLSTHPENVVIGFSGFDDPALKAALASGNSTWVNSFIVAGPNESPILNSSEINISRRQKFKQKVAAIAEYCKRKKAGLLTALIVSGFPAGFIVYETASVNAGVKAMMAIFAWAAFQGMARPKWEGYLDKGGHLAGKFLSATKRLFGRDSTERENHMYAVAGKFHASWLANTGVVTFVFASAGTLASGWEGAAQAAVFGFLGSTDIWDAVTKEKQKTGLFTEKMADWLGISRILLAGGFEVMGYLDVPNVRISLAVLATAGVSYLAWGNKVEDSVISSAKVVKRGALTCENILKQRRSNTRFLAQNKAVGE